MWRKNLFTQARIREIVREELRAAKAEELRHDRFEAIVGNASQALAHTKPQLKGWFF